MRTLALGFGFLLAVPFAAVAANPPKLKVLFLGDNGHHQPAARFRQLQAAFAGRNIDLSYVDRVENLEPKHLSPYDGLILYANHDKLAPAQEKALLDFVASGKGFIPLHCASACFGNSDAAIALIGAQFRSHTTGIFRTTAVKPDHPVMAGFQPFSCWDETYTHHKHNEKDRTVLEVRTDGDVKEPWTWVRTHGKGRVFYTAWGHDHRTWSHPGFHNLVERGVRWACGQEPALAGAYVDRPEMTAKRTDVQPFEYVPAKVPLYVPGGGRGGADQQSKMQKPLAPAESVKHFVTPKDFEVRTFVTEEKLGGKPVAMTWDEQGRLWLALTKDYPNELKPAGEGRDRIVVCEDADGDGVCDKVTEFADKLSIPTSLLNYAGGLIVHQAPHTLFLKDTDGDGKADVRQVLFTGWGTGDTHAGPSNLRYGFDNWIYGAVGYSGFAGEVAGEKLNFRQGFYRFKIEASGGRQPPVDPAKKQGADAPRSPNLSVAKLEFLRSTSNNTWGFGFSEDGLMFGSTANGCPLVHCAIPNRYYEKVRGLTPSVLPNIALDNHIEPITDKVRQVDWHGGFTAAAGCTIYTARTYPPEYWNKAAFVTEPTGHLAATFLLQPNGTEFVARYGWNLLASDDEWSAPIDTTVGPDGHMWVLDWYNYIVQHNPTPAGFTNGKGNAYETDLRDKSRGRIYRVVYTKAKPAKPFTLKGATPDQLVAALAHDNMGWRLHAQRLLVERGKWDIIEPLIAFLADRGGNIPAAVHAAAVFDGLDVNNWPKNLPDVQLVKELERFRKVRDKVVAALGEATTHPSAQVRQTVFRILGRRIDSPVGFDLDYVVPGLTDPELRVRGAALLALAELGEAGVSGLNASRPIIRALDRIENLVDPNLRIALEVSAVGHAGSTTLSLPKIELLPQAMPIVESAAAAAVSKPAGGDHVFMIFRAITTAHPSVREAMVAGITAGWPVDDKPELSPRDEQQINKALGTVTPKSRLKILKLVSNWGVKGLDAQLAELTKSLLATIADPKAADAVRLDAARQVIDFRPTDDDAPTRLLAILTPTTPPQLAVGLLDALAASKSKTLGSAVIGKLKDLPPSARPAALRLVLARPEAARAFLDAVEKGQVRFDMLELDQRTALASHPDRSLAERAKKLLALGGGLPDPDRQKVIEELASAFKKSGDPAAGKKLFVQHCAKCHKHGGEGQQIGPDLTGMAVHPKEELAIAILDPSRSVEGNYKAYTAKTVDGRVLTGLLAAETKTSVELVDAENKRHAVNRDDLDELKESAKSLMPDGFEKQMKPTELADLLEFLTQKGKFVPVALDKVATIVTTKGMFFAPEGDVERLIFPDWKPKAFKGVPFALVDPQGDRVKNAILLHGPEGLVAPTMPKSVAVPCNTPAKAIHLLSGVSGWGYPIGQKGSVTMIVRLHYADGKTEDHELKNGVHFADYIRRVDVPESQFAFALRGQQIRYLSVIPKRGDAIRAVEFVKGTDRSAPVVMAVTVETP